MDSYLAFDFETTGFDPCTDRVIQVGLCLVVVGQVTRQDGWLVNQDVRVPSEAGRVHGITTEDIRARGIPAQESLTKLLDAMRQAPACIGHNIHRFDIPFMLAECRRLGSVAPDTRDFVDTAALFKGWKLGMRQNHGESTSAYADRVLSIPVRGLKYSLPVCVRELGIKAQVSRLHDASGDAFLTHLIFQALQSVAQV